MTERWATFAVDLHLDVSGPAVRAGLEDALREAVRTGRLRPGTRLPSSRALAADLGIARNTVADAYGQLVAEGWLESRHGAGTWVAQHTGLAVRPVSAIQTAAKRLRYDLRAGTPDVSAFPRSRWLAASRRAMATASYDLLGYTDPRGVPRLRRALADYLSRARGVAASPDRIIVCSGFTEGLDLLCEVLHARGASTLAVEAYGHARHRHIAHTNGLGTTTLPVDSGGADIGALTDVDAVLLTPAHQFPIGVPLDPRRRRRVVEWAADSGAVVIEDDYDGEFRYDRQSIGSLQALQPEQVAYAGTASKSLAPGLRLGWLALPRHLIDDVVDAKALAGRLSSSLDQLTLAEFITSGAYDRQVRRARLAYRRRRDRLATAVRERAPHVRISGIAAGLNALLELPPDQREDDLVARAAEHGLAIEGLSTYSAAGTEHDPALVLGYATPPEHAFTNALARLLAVLTEPASAD